MEDLGLSAQEASEAALDYMENRWRLFWLKTSKFAGNEVIKQKELVMIGNIRVGGEGGMIAVDRWVSQLIRITAITCV